MRGCSADWMSLEKDAAHAAATRCSLLILRDECHTPQHHFKSAKQRSAHTLYDHSFEFRCTTAGSELVAWVKREQKTFTFTIAGRDVINLRVFFLGKLRPISSRRLARMYTQTLAAHLRGHRHAFTCSWWWWFEVMPTHCLGVIDRGYVSCIALYAPRRSILDHYRGAHIHPHACLLFRGVHFTFPLHISRTHLSTTPFRATTNAHPTTTTLQAILIANCPGYPGFLVPVI